MTTRTLWTVGPDSLETMSSLSTVESKASCEILFFSSWHEVLKNLNWTVIVIISFFFTKTGSK